MLEFFIMKLDGVTKKKGENIFILRMYTHLIYEYL